MSKEYRLELLKGLRNNAFGLGLCIASAIFNALLHSPMTFVMLGIGFVNWLVIKKTMEELEGDSNV